MERKRVTKEILVREREIGHKITVIQRKVDMDLRIKYRCLWLKAGDLKSSFFHYQCKECNRRNIIKEITLYNGGKINDPELIKKEGKTHFQELYTRKETISVGNMLSLSGEIPQLL